MRRKSHELQWLEVVNQRGGLNEEEIKIYQRLERGYHGELKFDKLCQFFFENEDQSMNDLTLRYQNNTIQIDKLIMSGDTLYLIDVKYYKSHYTFENNEWRVGQKILSNNIFEQLRRAVRITRNMFQEADLKVHVQGALVFINPESTIEVVGPVQEKVLSYAEIPSWLIEIRRNKVVEKSQWKNILRMFEIESYRTTRICAKERFNKLKKGICCKKCGGFKLSESWYKVICSCGHIEVRETAYVRTICEYGTIMHDRDLRKKDLKDFFQNYKDDYLKRVLKKHFIMKNSAGHNSGYSNKGKQFDYWFYDKKDYFHGIKERKYWKHP